MHKLSKRLSEGLVRHSNILLAILISLAIVISRRPDALFNPQLWAEDGTVFFAQAYNMHPLTSLFVPYEGSLQSLQRIVATLAAALPLVFVPLFFNVTAIAIQILPVILLWSPRFSPIVPNEKSRILLSFLYLAIPNSIEIDANITNGNWHLVLIAVMIILSVAPTRRTWIWFDRIALAIAGLSGPFTFFLMPLALAKWWRDRLLVSRQRFIILLSTTVVQGVVFVLTKRTNPARLGASVHTFVRIVAGQIFLAPTLGAARAQYFLGIAHFAPIVFLFGSALVAYCLWKGPIELKLLILFSALMFLGTLLKPQEPWAVLSQVGSAGRYFLFPMLTWLVCLLWLVTRGWMPLQVIAVLLISLVCVVGVPNDWSYPPFADLGFDSQVTIFNRLPAGSVHDFKINPNWQMVLTKH